MSWIHIDDLVDVYLKAIDDNLLEGPVNASSPELIQTVNSRKNLHMRWVNLQC